MCMSVMLREEVVLCMLSYAYPLSTPKIRFRIKKDPSKMRLIK